MSEELERYEPQSAVRMRPLLAPEEAKKYAQAFAASGMFKSSGSRMTPEQVFVCVMAGQEFGWGPAASMMNLHVIEGRPELSADAQARFIKASGKYEYRVSKHTNEECEITVLAVPSGEVIGVERYTIEDAKLAGLAGRGNWSKHPRAMLFARCISNVSAFHCPDALPMRTYSAGEISGADGETREAPTPEAIADAQRIEERVAEGREPVGVEPEEVIEDADVELEDEPAEQPEPQTSAQVLQQQVETRLREDLPSLTDEQRALIKAAVTSARPKLKWGYKAIAHLIVKAGYSDVNTWIKLLLTPGSREETPAGRSQADLTPVGESLPEGVTGAQTGSQSAATVTDAQIRMFNAKCSEAGLTDEERKYVLRHYAQVPSSRDIAKKDFDDLLAVLSDIKDGDDATRRVYLGGD